MSKISSFVQAVGASVVLIVLWSIASYGKLVSPIFFPTPGEVVHAVIVGVKDYSLLVDLWHTTERFVIAFFLAVAIGTPIGILMGTSHRIYRSLEFIVEFFRSIPTTALFPLFILFFGIEDPSKIAVATWGAGLIIIVNTMYGVHNIKKIRLTVANNLKLSPFQTLKEVVFFDALPQIVSGYRVALSISLVIIVVTEMFIGSRAGLGLRILNAQQVYRTDDMFAAIFTLGVFGFCINKLVQRVEEQLVHWRGR